MSKQSSILGIVCTCVLSAFALLAVSGCASNQAEQKRVVYDSDPATISKIPVTTAQKQLMQSLSRSESVREGDYKWFEASFRKFHFTGIDGRTHSGLFRDMYAVSVWFNPADGTYYVMPFGFDGRVCWTNLDDAKSFTDAINLLISVSKNGLPNAEDFDQFKEKAVAWRGLTSKPPLPDEVDRNRVLAENAYSEKRFKDAIDYYEQALEIEPCWPEGQFNAAMIAKELGDYAYAAYHMRCYLELVPDAKDARAAHDEIIIWEEKAKAPLTD